METEQRGDEWVKRCMKEVTDDKRSWSSTIIHTHHNTAITEPTHLPWTLTHTYTHSPPPGTAQTHPDIRTPPPPPTHFVPSLLDSNLNQSLSASLLVFTYCRHRVHNIGIETNTKWHSNVTATYLPFCMMMSCQVGPAHLT